MRKFFGCISAALLGAGVLVALPAVSVGAAPPTVHNEFQPPVVPPGGATSGQARCTGETAGDATVSLDGPGAIDVAATPVPLRPNGSNGVVDLRLGGPDGFGGVATDAIGDYVFTVACPSGGGTTDFVVEVLAPTLDFTGGASSDDCATSATDATIPLGMYLEYCYAFTNPMGEIVGTAGRVLAVIQNTDGSWNGTSFFYPGWSNHPPLPAGGDYQVSNNIGDLYEVVEADIYLVLEDASDNRVVSDLLRVRATPGPAIDVTVTSGLSEATACPSTGGLAARTVDAGTEVFFCYAVEMLSDIPIDDHWIDSDLQGLVGSDVAAPLSTPGETFEFAVSTPTTIEQSVVNNALWSATNHADYAPDDDIEATGSATVTVTGTETPTTTAPAGVSGANRTPAATPVTARPAFAG